MTNITTSLIFINVYYIIHNTYLLDLDNKRVGFLFSSTTIIMLDHIQIYIHANLIKS